MRFTRRIMMPIMVAAILVAAARPGLVAATDTWRTVASMGDARGQHTVTQLPDGTVLIAGGYGGNGSLASAERYDPTTDSWLRVPSMSQSKVGHTATLLPTGMVLVTGGAVANEVGNASPRFISTAELFDPSSNTWTQIPSMRAARYLATATLLPDGRVLVAGGVGGDPGQQLALQSAELYDPATSTWSAAASMRVVRYIHTGTLLLDGTVLVAGGRDPARGTQGSAERYDPVTNTWSAAGTLRSLHYSHTATLLPSGKVLITGGYCCGIGSLWSAELYDPVVNTWSRAADMNTARSGHTATLLPSGTVLVAGGALDSASTALASTELYDPDSDTWTTMASMNAPRHDHVALLLANGMVLVTGGIGNVIGEQPSRLDVAVRSTLQSVELYAPPPSNK